VDAAVVGEDRRAAAGSASFESEDGHLRFRVRGSEFRFRGSSRVCLAVIIPCYQAGPFRRLPDHGNGIGEPIMMRALISDIHGNLEALEAVLADIRGQRITEIICLGDIIGYGPNPRECIDLISETTGVCILGDHDLKGLFDQADFDTGKPQVDGARMFNDSQRRFLAERPPIHREGGVLFVHGSPRLPLEEYVFPEDVHHPSKMEALFSQVEKWCFQGHTHMPGIFTSEGRFLRPEEMNYRYRLGDGKAMVNVGSVGQPRDGDRRSCYVVLDEELITYRKIEYPLEKTIGKLS
jgi:predicted phosphodiesterase